jgi:hypothetical protein
MTAAKQQKVAPEVTPFTSGFEAGAQSADAAALGAVQYQMAVRTGDVPGAGTDGDVWLWVDGSSGQRTGWLYLDNGEDNFERNKTDYFYFELADLGTSVAAWIYFRPLGGSSEWFLSTVSVNGHVFTFHQWLVNEGMVQGNPT